jgi:hypothetical protein
MRSWCVFAVLNVRTFRLNLTRSECILQAAETLSGAPLEALLARCAAPPGYTAWVATGDGLPISDAAPAPAPANGRR